MLNNLDLTWAEKKARARELDEKKRRRPSGVEEGAKPPKRLKKLKFEIVEENLGEDVWDDGEELATVGADQGEVNNSGGELSIGSNCDNDVPDHVNERG